MQKMSNIQAQLSRTVAHALRHEPWTYSLELDEDGWLEVEELVAVLRRLRLDWSDLSIADIAVMVRDSPKNRYEIEGSRIRARYGHSVPERIQLPAASPPSSLFHGTSPNSVERILQEGLSPRAREYVHLSIDVDGAHEVGLRKAGRPVILRVASERAFGEGVAFYRGNERVWLADHVPPAFLSRM